MQIKNKKYNTFVKILEKELILATGCTEPVSLALAAAYGKELLGEMPEKIMVKASNNIIKNSKSVIIPNTNGMKGTETAIAIGLIAGNANKGLEVISEVTPNQQEEVHEFLKRKIIKVGKSESNLIFDILVELSNKNHKVVVRIVDYHTNIVYVSKDDKVLIDKTDFSKLNKDQQDDYLQLNVADIFDFANNVDLEEISDLIERQIEYNTKIANEGLEKNYGANISKVLLTNEADTALRAKAMAAAGSDARMSGSELPVVIVSGSGNQGITTVVPIVEFAKDNNASKEKLIRSVAFADLITLHLKRYIGRLSAYCGVVSAGAACGAGIAYLNGGKYEEIAQTITNTLATSSGIICDGAKPSCAAKIALAVEAGIMGYNMAKNGQGFLPGDGIVKDTVEETIRCIGEIGRIGMKETDTTIIDLMLKDKDSV